MNKEQNSNSHSPSRRTVLKGAAWSIPVIAAAIAVPVAAASTSEEVSGGTLHSNGSAGAWTVDGEPFGQLILNGINWNGYGATGDYAVGSVMIAISLPGAVSNVVEDYDEWNITYTPGGTSVVLTNAVVLPQDTVISNNDQIRIEGAFAGGAHYQVVVSPTGVAATGVVSPGDHVFQTWG